jgi:hypothetical protein
MSKDEKDPKAEPEEAQRWTAKRRTALVVSIIKGDASPQEAARKHGLTVAEVEEWKERLLAGAALGSSPAAGSALNHSKGFILRDSDRQEPPVARYAQ